MTSALGWTKRLLHIATGRSELVRICSSAGHSQQVSVRVYRCLQNSKDMVDLWKRFKQESSSGAPVDLEAWTRAFLKVKQTRPRSQAQDQLFRNLLLSLTDASQWERAKRTLGDLVDTRFQSKDCGHQELLERLWQRLQPLVAADLNTNKRDWRRLGFQGDDPSTDFRGMGVFALHQLVYFAETRRRVVQRIITEASEESWTNVHQSATGSGPPVMQLKRYYPFAVTGIHVSAFIVRLVQEDAFVDTWMGQRADTILQKINDLYCDTFILFHEHWRQGPERSVMDFPKVFRECCAQVEQQIRLGVFLPHLRGETADEYPGDTFVGKCSVQHIRSD
ncbi:ELMO CED-12 domain containing [Cyanidiococcus yangmingshanensis]|uniref:ELMO CED-12 domain containing n=1 Tax=Cyanidiococcus yangmingshanensis TaxID=2690220 RepID=A0A7J7IE59_9RHOD|nr:ELMO CED-12 domain containing [Cyanidiococcus yangmingshanensis]